MREMMVQENRTTVGKRLRTLRERKGWSLRQLSEKCGLSINAISRIERGENSPTITSLTRLAEALSIPITDFFSDKPKKSIEFIESGTGIRSQNGDITVEQLGRGPAGHQLEPFLLQINPQTEHFAETIHHPGKEFVLCLSGEVEFLVDDQVFQLEAGDSLLFEGMISHHYRNVSTQVAELLLVFQAATDNKIAVSNHKLD
jgi:transcriptional regulator with XRE-family HTH domain